MVRVPVDAQQRRVAFDRHRRHQRCAITANGNNQVAGGHVGRSDFVTLHSLQCVQGLSAALGIGANNLSAALSVRQSAAAGISRGGGSHACQLTPAALRMPCGAAGLL